VTKAKRILMDTKQFVKQYDGVQLPPPNIPTYQAPAGGWPGVPEFVAWTDHRGGGGRGSAADPQPSCATDDGGGGGEEGGRRCAPARKAAPPPATVRVLCGLALDVQPEQSLPPGPPVRAHRPGKWPYFPAGVGRLTRSAPSVAHFCSRA
jgi:hypothetical protein